MSVSMTGSSVIRQTCVESHVDSCSQAASSKAFGLMWLDQTKSSG